MGASPGHRQDLTGTSPAKTEARQSGAPHAEEGASATSAAASEDYDAPVGLRQAPNPRQAKDRFRSFARAGEVHFELCDPVVVFFGVH